MKLLFVILYSFIAFIFGFMFGKLYERNTKIKDTNDKINKLEKRMEDLFT